MGCASSKQKRCRHCHAPYSPTPRSYSMHVVHPPQNKGDNYHVVALTSTTLGSLALDSPSNYKDSVNDAIDIWAAKGNDEENLSVCDGQNGISDDEESKTKEFSVGLIEAKSWSNMIQEKIPKIVPKTPVRTPPGEPETINAWELMAGLEEDDGSVHLPHRFRSFSFDVSRYPSPVLDSPGINGVTFSSNKSQTNRKPLWLQLADEEANSHCPEFDPQIFSAFRKSFQDLSPTHPFYLKPSDGEKQQSPATPASAGNNQIKEIYKGGKEKVVVYFTSLRGVRKTYEDCCHVRVILKSLGVRIDERDVSMHSGFKEELRELLGEGFSGGGLPKVFVGIKYIGGAEEIRRMHEEGELEKVVEDCEMVQDSGGIGNGTCEACGDIRFVPCETCSGSCKIYYERDEEEEEAEAEAEAEAEEDGEYGFQRCQYCNENGLIRCPICCY
ncbi:hypothetical protein P3X46_034026 [Hevea brasiliensis]|uniref:Glutaredoxin domain-containing protein n=1 Tax=Hevea brasiliensis TaxID=3981 RepID=A0ABQ9K936_HEVBR|nr:uncharacterized protein At5g39865 [Hevea brasiliensis]KAJ9129185.1 hypothetical protein P3X46_034026 [Hevea brasiliensis]